MLPRIMNMGPRDRTQTWCTVHSTGENLRTITTGIIGTSQVRQRTPRKRIHPTLKKPLCRTILLYKEERRETKTCTRLPTPQRMDYTKPLPPAPHPSIDQPCQNEDALHQVRRSLGIQQRAH